MDHIFHADDAKFSKAFPNQGIISQSNALLVDLAITTLVDQLMHRLQVWITPCNIGFNNPQHVDRSFVELDECAIKNLTQAKKLQHLTDLGADAIDASYPDHKGKLGFSWNVVIAGFSGHPGHADLLPIHVPVLLVVSFGSFIDDFSLCLTKLFLS